MTKSYSGMLKYDTLQGRFNYLSLDGKVAEETFGRERYLNQAFYSSYLWKRARDEVIIRDEGCDLGIPGFEIFDRVLVHHINPITPKDLYDQNPVIFDPENLICVSHRTHNAIHYGDDSLLPTPIVERRPGDTLMWERKW